MEQERCTGIFTNFNNTFKSQFNETMKSLQFHSLNRQTKENVEEWMDRLRLAVAECIYREVDRQFKEQFLHGLSDNEMLTEIIRNSPNLWKVQIYQVSRY